MSLRETFVDFYIKSRTSLVFNLTISFTFFQTLPLFLVTFYILLAFLLVFKAFHSIYIYRIIA